MGANSLLELIIYQLIYNHEKKCINSLDNRDPSNKSLIITTIAESDNYEMKMYQLINVSSIYNTNKHTTEIHMTNHYHNY